MISVVFFCVNFIFHTVFTFHRTKMSHHRAKSRKYKKSNRFTQKKKKNTYIICSDEFKTTQKFHEMISHAHAWVLWTKKKQFIWWHSNEIATCRIESVGSLFIRFFSLFVNVLNRWGTEMRTTIITIQHEIKPTRTK